MVRAFTTSKRDMKNSGKFVGAWILPRQLKAWNSLDNKSEFLQIALDNYIDVVTFALMKDYNPRAFKIDRPLSEQRELVDAYNKRHPLNVLTAARMINNGQNPYTDD